MAHSPLNHLVNVHCYKLVLSFEGWKFSQKRTEIGTILYNLIQPLFNNIYQYRHECIPFRRGCKLYNDNKRFKQIGKTLRKCEENEGKKAPALVPVNRFPFVTFHGESRLRCKECVSMKIISRIEWSTALACG